MKYNYFMYYFKKYTDVTGHLIFIFIIIVEFICVFFKIIHVEKSTNYYTLSLSCFINVPKMRFHISHFWPATQSPKGSTSMIHRSASHFSHHHHPKPVATTHHWRITASLRCLGVWLPHPAVPSRSPVKPKARAQVHCPLHPATEPTAKKKSSSHTAWKYFAFLVP